MNYFYFMLRPQTLKRIYNLCLNLKISGIVLCCTMLKKPHLVNIHIFLAPHIVNAFWNSFGVSPTSSITPFSPTYSLPLQSQDMIVVILHKVRNCLESRSSIILEETIFSAASYELLGVIFEQSNAIGLLMIGGHV